MTLSLAQRLQTIKPSATLEVSRLAAALKKQGKDILSFNVGEPDFQTPSEIQSAAVEAVPESSHYTPVGGIDALRQAVAEDSKRRRGVEHKTDEILVSVGAKHTLFNLAMALFDPGDEIIIPAPYWVSYPEQAALVGANPVIVNTKEEDGFCLTPDALSAAITPKTKALVLCTPSNPTGSAYSKERLEALLSVIRTHGFYVILDEIYAHLVYEGFQQHSMLELAPDLKERLIIVDGVSKTYAMTGWRIGWCLAPAAIIKACDTIQGQSTTNPTAVAQYAAMAALKINPSILENMRVEFEKRRNYLIKALNTLDGLSCRMPEGAFYAFANVRGLLGKTTAKGVTLQDDVNVCTWLLEDAGCALVPGTAFGAPGFLRMSYATSMQALETGIARMREAIGTLT